MPRKTCRYLTIFFALAVAACAVVSIAAKKVSITETTPTPLFDEAVTDGGGLWEFRRNGRTLVAAITDETGAVRIAHWFFQGRAVRAEYMEADGRREALGIAGDDGKWNWYRREGDRYLPFSVHPIVNDPMIDDIKALTGRLLSRRIVAGVNLMPATPAPAFPFPGEGDEVGMRISIAHNVPSPESPLAAPDAPPIDLADPETRETLLAGESIRRTQLLPIRLPRQMVRDFLPTVFEERALMVDRDAFGETPPIRASLFMTATVYRVFEPSTVSLEDGVERRRLHLCAHVVIESYVDDGFCLDEALEKGQPIVHSQAAQDPAGRDWGSWFVEVYLE